MTPDNEVIDPAWGESSTTVYAGNIVPTSKWEGKHPDVLLGEVEELVETKDR